MRGLFVNMYVREQGAPSPVVTVQFSQPQNQLISSFVRTCDVIHSNAAPSFVFPSVAFPHKEDYVLLNHHP